MRLLFGKTPQFNSNIRQCSNLVKSHLVNDSQVAADLLLTGRLVKADEALNIGLVAKVGESAMTIATDIAQDISLSGPVSIRTLVQTLRKKQDVGLQEAYEREATAQSICYPTSDLAEGVT